MLRAAQVVGILLVFGGAANRDAGGESAPAFFMAAIGLVLFAVATFYRRQ